jgi:hypothetical protein
MTRSTLLLVLPVMLACSKTETPAADPASAASTNMNVAGKWAVRVMPEGQDTTLLIYMLDATNTSNGWKMTLPNRQPMDSRVLSMNNDSVVVENGPYPSVLQKNTMVKTHSTLRLEGDKLVGKTIAHYDTKGPDSIRVLRTEGTRQ